MELSAITEKIREKRDILIIALLVIGLLLLVVVGYRMQRNYSAKQEEAVESSSEPQKVTISRATGGGAGKQGGNGEEGTALPQQGETSTTYYLTPSAEEVLTLVRESGQAQLPKEGQQYTGFRIIWPCYFFGVQQLEGSTATVMFDITEDGFGATIITDMDTSRYPEVTTLERGKKVWLAGEILSIDPTGTGTIRLIAEELRLEEGLLEAIGKSSDIGDESYEGR